jgi:tetratricopeptide (TPR) repeat protein
MDYAAKKMTVPTKEPPASNIERWQVLAVCLVLAAITFAVFGQTAGFRFINYDDDIYVYDNPVVTTGFTLKGAVWALTYGEIGHWHPLTWMTHMADCQVHGLWAGGHHLTNVALHAAAAVLLFLALREMTGNLWRCAFVAAVFAVHPLRVESVAWIAERKDVLSGVFFMLTLWAYARYARQPSRGRYAEVALWYCLGLLCKNMLVTLPFVLLLLDWWPLDRMTLDGADGGKLGAPFWRLVREKIPLFLLSVGSCVATVLAPEKVLDSYRLPFLERMGNALVSYGVYLWQMVFPGGLAIPYLNPPNGQPLWKVGAAFVLLAAISISVVACRRTRPYLMTGWLWYLGMLVPVIGIVQISFNAAHADRYTYLPGIGLVLAGTWAVGDWSPGWKQRRAALCGLMAAVISVLMACAWKQTTYWKSDETLWTHTLACTTGNYLAHCNLAEALLQKGKVDEAIAHYQKVLQIKPDCAQAHYDLAIALRQIGKVDDSIAQYQNALQIYPDYAEAHNNLAEALLQKGRADEAITQYQKILQIKPDNAKAHFNLAIALRQKGRVDEAIAQYQNALQINPDYAEAHNNLGNALRQKGRVDEAITHFQDALQIKPDYAEAHYNLGIALQQNGRADEAIAQYQKALQIKPADPAIQNDLAWLLATCPEASLRNGDKAVQLAQRANELAGGKNPVFLHTLAAAFAEAGRFSDALRSEQKAIELARAAGRQDMAGQFSGGLKRYEAGLPLHQ